MPLPWKYQTDQPGYYGDTAVNSFGGVFGAPSHYPQNPMLTSASAPMASSPAMGGSMFNGDWGQTQAIMPRMPVVAQPQSQPTMTMPPAPQAPMGLGAPSYGGSTMSVNRPDPRLRSRESAARAMLGASMGPSAIRQMSNSGQLGGAMNMAGQMGQMGYMPSRARNMGGTLMSGGQMYQRMGGGSTWPGYNQGGGPGNPFLGNAGGWRYGQIPGMRQGYGGYTGSQMPGVGGGGGGFGGLVPGSPFAPGGGSGGFPGGPGMGGPGMGMPGGGGSGGGDYSFEPWLGGSWGDPRLGPGGSGYGQIGGRFGFPGQNMGLPSQGRDVRNEMPRIVGGGGGPVMGGGSGGGNMYYPQGGSGYYTQRMPSYGSGYGYFSI